MAARMIEQFFLPTGSLSIHRSCNIERKHPEHEAGADELPPESLSRRSLRNWAVGGGQVTSGPPVEVASAEPSCFYQLIVSSWVSMRPPVVSFTPYPIAVLLLTGRTSIPDQFSEARSGLDPFWRTSKMWGVAPERMSRRRSESSEKGDRSHWSSRLKS